jgi:gamma-F420-2:alpha-L-glutamate ligase
MKPIARGWLLWRPDPGLVKQESYEIDRLVEAAPVHGYEVEVVDPDKIELVVNSEGKASLVRDGEYVDPPDFAVPRMGSMTDYFTLSVIRQLESVGVLMVNGSSAVANAQDKLYHLQLLAKEGVPIPKTMLVRFPVNADFVERELGFPIVVKTLVGTQGSGVTLFDTKSQLVDLLQFVEANNPKAQLVLQQFLAESKGRDVRVVAIGGQIVAAMERRAQSGFKSNYSQGGTAVPFETGPKNALGVASICRILGMEMVGIDLLYDDEVGMRICEVNSSPGFEGLEKTCGVDVPMALYRYLDIRYRISNKAKARMLGKDLEEVSRMYWPRPE